jgi:hypothetical protein
MSRICRLALIGAVTATLGTAGVLAGTGVASAASVHPAYFNCTGAAGPGVCTDVNSSTTMWLPNNTPKGTLPPQSGIEVTCWYPRNGGDGYWDHVVWEQQFGYATGHVADDAVNFNGQTPNNVPGLHRC